MKSSGKNIELASFDSIFSTEETRQGGNQRIQQLPLSELVPFKDHPFRVVDDDRMKETVESIQEYGVLVPIIVRPMDDGSYEIVSGHRRKPANWQRSKRFPPLSGIWMMTKTRSSWWTAIFSVKTSCQVSVPRPIR